MKTKKKLIAILLIAAILSSFLPNLLSFAETGPDFQIYVSGTTNTSIVSEVGKEIFVDLKLENGLENRKNITFILDYDPTVLEPIADEYDGETPMWTESFSLELASVPIKMASLIETGEGHEGIAVMIGGSKLKTAYNIGKFKFKVIGKGNTDIAYKSVIYAGMSDGEEDIPVDCSNKLSVLVKNPITDFTLPEKITINKGKSETLKATITPEDTTDSTKISWKSSNPSVATVDENGKVTAVNVGTATITGTCGTFSDTTIVTVDNPMIGILLNKVGAVVNRGEELQLEATKNPSDTTDTTPVTWISSNPEVATVDNNGKVTALKLGKATITATCGTHSLGCEIDVVAKLDGISIDKKEAGINKGEFVELKVITNPLDTTDHVNVVWNSSNEDVATVDQNGVVTGKKLGKTTITATVTTPEKTHTATCEVTVNVHIDKIEIVNPGIDNNRNLELYKNQTADLTIDFTPDEFAESKTIIWESSDENVAKVENGKVTAMKPGTATITATTVNGVTDKIDVIVPVVNATKLTINKNNTSIEKGDSEQLTATVLPENTTDEVVVTWKSSDENVVTVVDGLVTAVGVGTATITAEATGLEKAECNVVVTCELISISLDKNELKLEAGQSSDALVVIKNPTDATVDLADVKWTSKNESVATVVDGVITAVAPGNAIIEAELEGQKAFCEVTVIVTLTSVEIENGNTTLELIKGQTSDLKVVYTPTNATEIPEAIWSTSDEDVAKVENGKVTALKEGIATITVDYGNGITAARKVDVKEIHADTIVIDRLIETLNKNETVDLTATMTPTEATDEITWSTTDETIAKIDNNGKLTALKAGKVKVIATASNGKTAEMEIEVKEVSLESIKVSAEKSIEEGKQTQVKVEVNPENTTDDLVYTYKSSNESIATVDKNGKVTAKKAGDVVITVSVDATNGEGETKTVTSQVKLTVKEKTASAAPGTSAPAGSTSAPVAALTTSPHTGDMNIVALAVMMVISLAGMIVTIKKK